LIWPLSAGGFMACQSLDNTIRVFSTRDRFKEMRKKIFRGTHTQTVFTRKTYI
jgi:hypothetical protein